MRVVRLVGLAVLLTGALFTLFAQVDMKDVAEGEPVRYAKIRRPLPNIYEKLDPKSNIIRQGKRGEYLEVRSLGDSWVMVDVDGKRGFLERKAVDIVDKKSNPAAIMFLIVIVLMAGCAGCVMLFIKKQQQQVAVAGDPLLD